ncbi:MAG: SusC/RagA family TonB-linked outer membrane protein [Bacteroidales bacterium]|nr:SusC/RagA family TonB-linked outer membrane protein [Bacteroidales bacterium]
MKAKKLLLALLGMVTALSLSAQTTVKGIVTDEAGEPLIGAGVMVEGSTVGTITGIDGDYVLALPENAVNLVFSFIGLAEQTVAIAGQQEINVVLRADQTFLDEVVVVGYATVKRRDLLGSVSSVGADKLTEQPVTSVSQALSGKMAGVSVVTTEGDPDADIKIRVRGGGSITQDSSPLYIVDGFPVESINDIPSSEIQSIDVLKDAFSTAIYGSRGANGVVIVTTKSAEKGQKISVKLNAYYGLKTMANKNAIQPMDAENFVKFQYELAAIRENLDTDYIPYYGLFDDIDQYKGMATNDWIAGVFGRTGSSLSTDASISGSGDKYNWTLGYARMGDKAIMVGSNYVRNNLSFKGHFDTSKNTSIDASIRYSLVDVRGAGANSMNDAGTTSGNGRLKHAVQYSPIPVSTSRSASEDETLYGDNVQPLRAVADNDSKRSRSTWTVNGAFNWTIVDNLKLKIEGGLEDFRQTDDRFYGLSTYFTSGQAANGSQVPGTPSNNHKELFRKKYRNTNTLNYDFAKLFNNEDHQLTVLLGEELTISKSNLVEIINDGFPTQFTSEEAWIYSSASSYNNTARDFFYADDNLLSFFGRVNYDYKHRYSVGATLRADGSSKFGKGHRWGFFPSAAVSWTLSNEKFMEGTHGWLDQLKLRYSFGTAGNNNIPSGVILKEYDFASTAIISQGTRYGYAGTVLNNEDLTWETTYTHNLGLDFGFWQGRLSGSIEAYQNDTKNLLVQFPVAGSGYSTQYRNLGSTRNRGIELTLNAPVISKKDYSLNIGGNIAFNKNVVTSLGGNEAFEKSGISGNSGWASSEVGVDYLVQVGQPMGNIYGYIADGRYGVEDFDYVNGDWVLKDGIVDDSAVIGKDYLRPGALKLKNVDNSDDNKVNVTDRTVIGNTLPKFTGGFNLSGYVKGFDFSANFNFMLGQQVYNANKIEFTSSRKYTDRNLLNMMDVDKRWTNIDWETGELISDPDKLMAVNAGTTMWSPAMGSAVLTDWAVEDGSFLRLQSVTLGYTLPAKLTEKVNLSKVRFYVTGTNLFCLTKYSGYDPEVDTRRTTPLTPGVDYSAYPKSIGFVAGVNLAFGKKNATKVSAPVVSTPEVREVVKEIVKEKVVEKVVEKKVEVPVSTLKGIYEDDLYFLIGQAELRPEESFKLGQIAQILKDNPDAKITITGYADSGTGSAAKNQSLSAERAAAVVSLLKSAGISANRITSAGTGSDKDASKGPEANRVAVCIVK